MPMRLHFELILGLLLAVACIGNAAANGIDCSERLPTSDDQPRRIKMETHYPQGQLSMLGEGWVQLGFSVSPAGKVSDIWVIDMVGAPVFAHTAARSLITSTWQAAPSGGKSLGFHGELQMQFLVSGKNRAGVHARVSQSYDTAKALRDLGNHKRSAEILHETSNLTLNMYEYAITSYGLMISYWGMSDWRRALRHARHATIDQGMFADTAQRKSALAFLTELEAMDHSYQDSLCALQALKKEYPDYQPTAHLQELLTGAQRDLQGSTPVRTEVELIESGREEIATHWRHVMLRRTAQLSAVQGNVTRARMVCPTLIVDEKLPLTRAFEADQGLGPCTLYVFGDPGARFVLDER